MAPGGNLSLGTGAAADMPPARLQPPPPPSWLQAAADLIPANRHQQQQYNPQMLQQSTHLSASAPAPWTGGLSMTEAAWNTGFRQTMQGTMLDQVGAWGLSCQTPVCAAPKGGVAPHNSHNSHSCALQHHKPVHSNLATPLPL